MASPADDGYRAADQLRGRPGPAWSPPTALPEMPPVPVFPIDLFPAAVRDYWTAAADSLARPVDYVAVPALPILGAAVGRALAASVKRTYREPPLFWVVPVAPPGRTKSPALRFAKGPLPTLTAQWRAEHAAQMETYEGEKLRYKKALEQRAKDPGANERPAKPVRPILRQLTLDNATTEYPLRANANNPRGVVLTKDELLDRVNAPNQYKGGQGNDKQVLLPMWAGSEPDVGRVKDLVEGAIPLHLSHTFVGVSGMIQPDVPGLLRGDYGRREFLNDGWADRFLTAYPDPPPLIGENRAIVPEELEAGYARVYDTLLAMPMVDVEGGGCRPYFVTFDPAAEREWENFTNGIAERANALDPSDNYVPLAGKLRDYRAATKRTGTYGRTWLEKHATADGRTLPSGDQLGAESGRISCSAPNLQQVPRGSEYRKCFTARPGCVLAKADYSQIELRIAAKVAGETVMIGASAAGRTCTG